MAKVRINGTEYYCIDSLVNDLEVIDNKLINFGTSTIYLYNDIPSQNENNTYPYIRVNSLKTATIYESDRNYHELNVVLYEVLNRKLEYSISNIFILIIIMGVLVCQLFKR